MISGKRTGKEGGKEGGKEEGKEGGKPGVPLVERRKREPLIGRHHLI
jgi:hypothetical protein